MSLPNRRLDVEHEKVMLKVFGFWEKEDALDGRIVDAVILCAATKTEKGRIESDLKSTAKDCVKRVLKVNEMQAGKTCTPRTEE